MNWFFLLVMLTVANSILYKFLDIFYHVPIRKNIENDPAMDSVDSMGQRQLGCLHIPNVIEPDHPLWGSHPHSAHTDNLRGTHSIDGDL